MTNDSAPSVGDFELSVMLAVVRLGDDAYGAEICRDLTERAQRDVAVGAVITTLHRLERKKLLASTMSDPLPVRGGRARRCFHLTTAGSRALAHATAYRQRLWQMGDAEPESSR